ncbi:DUF1919 domain-containing protein [Hespellia stercorisuis]|uniref:Uncharacterized protein, DUF1919 family n=1 Tax=Hespellia stercorisuis DSM 15480 TaxID=1121950 RepID=A0A1M6JYJ7_9FIRM|nr:DUF1919 domain-containing protein [Hespellia stercorisuis]SHJ51738.1 Uncharacterized protein, DUF1919 family [Hespellia stercorisuis DSM 15480]
MKAIYRGVIATIGKMNRKKWRNAAEKKRLQNTDFTILCNNCIGGVISHDMGLRFLSPTVNLYIRPFDFVKMLKNLDYYLSADIVECESTLPYPVGKLDDIIIFFKHFKTIDEAREKWDDRKKRINWDNVYVMMTDRWCCPYSTLQEFENLPFKNKVCFTLKEYPEFASCRQVTKWHDKGCVGVITNVVGATGKRMYQYAKQFDYITWLNKK